MNDSVRLTDKENSILIKAEFGLPLTPNEQKIFQLAINKLEIEQNNNE